MMDRNLVKKSINELIQELRKIQKDAIQIEIHLQKVMIKMGQIKDQIK